MPPLIQIMRSLRSMPPFPDVAARVMAITRDPDYSIAALVGVVRTDPSLTTRILKICNSSLFSLATPITSVADAVSYLGTRNLVKLVLVSCTASYFKDMPANSYANATDLWRQTIACATACEALASRCQRALPAIAFTAGILHNLGRVAMVQVVDPATLERASEELQNPDVSPLIVERRVLGLDHAAASGIVTDTWNLPMELRRAARNHHDPARMGLDDDLTALLHTADELVMGMGLGDPCRERRHAPCPEALHRLQLQTADLETVVAKVAVELANADELLNPEAVAGR